MTIPTTRIVLITGGSRGLGRASALALAEPGTGVVITYRSQAAEADAVVAEIAAKGGSALALQLDTSVSAGFPAFVTALREAIKAKWDSETIHALVNNAGVGINMPFAETTEDAFDQMFAMHVKGVFFLTQKLLPVIADGGRIVNVSSGLARFSMAGYSAYAAAKGAVEVMSRYMAQELGPRGITVNVIAPGAIETDFGGAVRDNAALNAGIASQTALGRVGQPDDIGGAVAALLSPGNRWVNAQRIEVSGGVLI